MPELHIGPILSYRGIERDGGIVRWKVSVLIGVAHGAAKPVLLIDGVQGPEGLTLADRAGVNVLRYDLSVTLGAAERRVRYGFQGLERSWDFTAPCAELHVRSAYVSCNGTHSSEEQKREQCSENVWHDLVVNHDFTLAPSAEVDKQRYWHLSRGRGTDVQRFHVMLMGGDQIYFDAIWEKVPELAAWSRLSQDQQLAYPVTEDLASDIRHYYFQLYRERWLGTCYAGWTIQPATFGCADAMARIPTVMMWDDHDIFDGYGSYSQEKQECAVVQTIFRAAREAFWVFQLQHPLTLLPALAKADGLAVKDAPNMAPIPWAVRLAGDPLALPLLDGQPGFSYPLDLGRVQALVLDLRTERSRTQILGEATWQAAQGWLARPAPGPQPVHHLLVLASVPVAHPKFAPLEDWLDVFDSEHVTRSLNDDVRDHWSHEDHEAERLRLTRVLLDAAAKRRLHVSIVSGDVHVAAWGRLYRKDAAGQPDATIDQLTSSGVVNSMPGGFGGLVLMAGLNRLARKVQELDAGHACKMMKFPAHDKPLMGARNWLALELDHPDERPGAPRLWASWRCETGADFSNHQLAIDPAP
jgi:hypothetical protein